MSARRAFRLDARDIHELLLPSPEDEPNEHDSWPQGLLARLRALPRSGVSLLTVEPGELTFLRRRVQAEISNTDSAGAEVWRDLLRRLA